MDRKRIARGLILVAALAVALLLGRQWPKDQTVHYVLGDASARTDTTCVVMTSFALDFIVFTPFGLALRPGHERCDGTVSRTGSAPSCASRRG